MSDEHERLGRAVGDARKRMIGSTDPRTLLPNHDEQHAHLHEWPEPDVVLGEE